VPRSYNITKANWLGTRYTITDMDGKILYEARLGGRRHIYFQPGIEQPRFEARPQSFWSMTTSLVETDVEYEFAYIKPYAASGSMCVVMNVAEEPIGFVINADAWARYLNWRKENETSMERREPADVLRQALRVKTGFRESMASAMKMGKTYHLVSASERIAVTFDVPKDKKSVLVTVFDDTGRYFDLRLSLELGLRCLTAQNRNNGA
jgi:hypothetical protein